MVPIILAWLGVWLFMVIGVLFLQSTITGFRRPPEGGEVGYVLFILGSRAILSGFLTWGMWGIWYLGQVSK